MSKKKKKIFLIDGQGLIYRAYFALPRLTTSYGQLINAAYGFTLVLVRIIEENQPDGIIIAFDTPKPTFRHKQYDQYKAQREKMPPELIEQIPIIKEIVSNFNIPAIEVEEFEADDIIGSLVQKMKDSDYKPVIVTGDRDLLQLVGEDTEVLLMQKGVSQVEQHNMTSIEKILGFSPHLIPDYIGLKGDSSDNIPGIPGIGEKTARRLIQQFGNLEEILKNINQIENKFLREKIVQYQKQAILSKKLAMIRQDVTLNLDISKISYPGPDYDKLKALFSKYEFKKLLKKIPQKEEKSSYNKESRLEFQKIDHINKLTELCQKVKENSSFSFLLKTYPSTSAQLWQGIAIGITDEVFLLTIDNQDSLLDNSNYLSKELILTKLAQLFQDEKIEKIGFNLKNSWSYLYHNIDFFRYPYFDIEIASYLLNPSQQDYDLTRIIKDNLSEKSDRGENSLWYPDFSDWKNTICWQTKLLLPLKEVLWEKLCVQKLDKLYQDVELPLIRVIYLMERKGIKLDNVFIKKMSQQFSQKIVALRDDIFNLAGEKFNLNSPKQLSQILFEKLKLPKVKKIKTGYSTDAQVLLELREKHEIIAKILDYRELEKLKNTYIDKLPRLINPRTGRIHSTFNQTGTTTGRLSSNNPNLQNIPVRTELGKAIRNAFIAEPGYIFLSADYSQIELRILAHLSKDKNLKKAFLEGKDIHTYTAAQLFNVDINLVNENMRRIAKSINFGIIYGMSSYGLAANLRISREDAEQYIEAYFQKYSQVKDYIDKQVALAKKNKYVKTMLNRIRYLEGIDSPNKSIREFYERIAINTPIQGTAADLIKMAMVGINSHLEKLKLESGLILQIHDELIYEIPEPQLEYRQTIIRDIMENCLHLEIPLKVNFKSGYRWGDLE